MDGALKNGNTALIEYILGLGGKIEANNITAVRKSGDPAIIDLILIHYPQIQIDREIILEIR